MNAGFPLNWGLIMAEATVLPDDVREAAIKECGLRIEEAMREAVKPEGDYFTARAVADSARERMEALIKGRSPEAVARMEQERGLTNA